MMSYQISFVPRLTLSGQPITLSELRDKARPIGYEYTAKPGEAGISLGTLTQLANDLEKLMKLDDTNWTSDLNHFIPTSVFGDKATQIINNIANTNFYLTHLKFNTETKDKEISITGSMNDIQAFGIAATGFSLNISSGPDGSVAFVGEDKKTVTVTLRVCRKTSPRASSPQP